ncbi:MAG TPA: dipeptide epimerase, partial [Gemmatimonadales bacterium]|nr:dipeptide epimerase [Gemmatimonadales bacterium]
MSSSLRMEAEVLNLRTRHPFIISRGGQSDYRTIWVRLVDQDGVEGWGEAAPARIYGESTETVLASLQNYAEHLAASPFHLEDIERQWETQMRLNPAARCALSAALHDLMGKKLGVPVYQLWGLNPARAPRSTFTIGIDTAEKLRQKVLEAEEYPILKIKLGTDRDIEILKTIRELTPKELRVDANTGWNTKQAIRMLPVLEEFGVTVLEQPLPADDLDGLAQVTRHSRIPVIADESCLVAADIPRLVG